MRPSPVSAAPNAGAPRPTSAHAGTATLAPSSRKHGANAGRLGSGPAPGAKFSRFIGHGQP
jgi:hypothetical protein